MSSNDVVEVPPLNQMQQDIISIKQKLTEITNINNKLKGRIYELAGENRRLYDSIYNIEVSISGVDQYSRRSNIELCGVPERIRQRDIEEYVLGVLASLDIHILSYDLVAVHRVGRLSRGKNRNVIVRFVNRKNAYLFLRKSKDLKKSTNTEYKSLYVIENLCPTNKKIFNFLYKVKKLAKIKSVWTYNGSVFYKFLDSDDDFAERADHLDDVSYLYDEIDLPEIEISNFN